MTAKSLAAVFLVSVLGVAGCVKRTILIESDPPGASVRINEHPVGTTPVSYEFITHGRYLFRLEKTGFRELMAREMVRAPIYQWIPIDFVAEWLLPVRLEDKHVFRYRLTAQSSEEKLRGATPSSPADLLAGLKDPNPENRRRACVLLASARDASAAPAISQVLSDPSPIVRSAALGAWRSIQGSDALDRLQQALKSDRDREVRWRAAIELEALGDRKAVPALIAALKDSDHLVRTGAAEALKGIPDPQAVRPLIRSLREKDAAVRRAATEGLGRIGDRSAVPALIRVLFHHDVQTRRKAAEALAHLNDPRAGRAFVRTFTDWDPKVRTIATDALIASGNTEVVPLLIRRLRAWKPWTREHAARALGGLKDPRAIGVLKTAFQRESDPPASKAMYDALVALGAPMDPSWEKILEDRVNSAEAEKQKQAQAQKAAQDSSKGGTQKNKGFFGKSY